MPLFQPSNITPSSFAGVGGGTVAAADNVKITWQVNGNVAMTAYRIEIYDFENNIVYSSGILRGGTPFYPTDNKGNPQYFSYEPNVAWETLGLLDGNDYTLQITQYWGNSTSAAYSVKQFSQSAFITRTKPSLQLFINDNVAENLQTLASDMCLVRAEYTQEQNDAVDWVRWKFYQIVAGKEILIDDTKTVNTQELSYSASGMRSDNSYKIVCEVQTANGVIVAE